MTWETLEAIAAQQVDSEKLFRVIQNCVEVSGNMNRRTRGKDVVLVLGETGAGKSLLINALLGLQLVESDSHPNCWEVKSSDRTKGAYVGHGNVSATFLPES